MSKTSKNSTRVVARVVLIPTILFILAGFVDSRKPKQDELMYAEPIIVTQPRPPEPQGDLYVFLGAVAQRESNNTQHVVNRIGMLGKYQFSPKTLWGLGMQFKVTRAEFLGNSALQDSAMIQYLRDNRTILRDVIVAYDGKWYGGIYITESGLLAGAHLVGPHGLRAFFEPDYTVRRGSRVIRPLTKDGNGTKVVEYIEEFSGYDLHALGATN